MKLVEVTASTWAALVLGVLTFTFAHLEKSVKYEGERSLPRHLQGLCM